MSIPTEEKQVTPVCEIDYPVDVIIDDLPDLVCEACNTVVRDDNRCLCDGTLPQKEIVFGETAYSLSRTARLL